MANDHAGLGYAYRNLANFIDDDNIHGLQLYLDGKVIAVDSRDENAQTPLMVACQRGRLNFVLDLMAHGADVNATDADNWTPLLNAAKAGHAEIVTELLEHGATIDHQDLGGWTALMWACYKNRGQVVKILLHRNADPNIQAQFQISCLLWASGRGYTDIARDLLAYGAKVGSADKYGTTSLVWACRRGNAEIVEMLLKSGANVDTAGMFALTPLLVATKGNYVDVVHLLLDYKPNLNSTDQDGCAALTLACKEGYSEIVGALLHCGSYVNNHDRSGDTNLIHAVKGNHYDIVDALVKKYADVDAQGNDKKSALYWAVEKGYVDIVRLLLRVNPDLELATVTGDTALIKSVRSRNTELVQILLDHKAKVSAVDKLGDTALHVAMRSRSKAIVEILLRNPKNSQLLYRPNKAAETPYNIDSSHQRNILGQIFGARRLNTNEDNENMLGYDLYSSALADFLSEPTLSVPICVGLYAKWGSGKSFLLGKLRNEMENFAYQWFEPTYEWSMFVLLLVLHVAFVVGATVGLTFDLWLAGAITAGVTFVLVIVMLCGIAYGNQRYEYGPFNQASIYIARKLSALKLFLLVVFCHPPLNSRSDPTLNCQPIKFLFTETARVTSATSEGSVGKIVCSMFDVLEKEYGVVTTRLYKVFRPKPVKSVSWKFRRICCFPTFLIVYLVVLCIVSALFLVTSYHHLLTDSTDETTLGTNVTRTDNRSNGRFSSPYTPVLLLILTVVSVIIVANACTLFRVVATVCYPTKRRIARAAKEAEDSETKGRPGMASLLLQPLQANVQLVADMVRCLDAFTGNQSRVVIVVDSLDSCEQDKVLHNLDTVHLLFSNAQLPFITILAIDPHIIIKAIETNIHRVFHDSSINGHDYLRNIIHLPFFLQNSGLRRVQSAQNTATAFMQRRPTNPWGEDVTLNVSFGLSRRMSSESSMSIPDRVRQQQMRSKRLKTSDSIASSMSNIYRVTAAQDLTKVLLTDDYFSDVNPRSMRRLMNVVYITGRLLKAFNMEFNWYHLASWVNITEQWPYRTSWIILYYERLEDELEDAVPLKSIYDKVKKNVPLSKDIEPMLEIDRDERKFEIFLSFHKSSLQVAHLKMFLPFTISLDPYIRKIIKEEQQNWEELMKFDPTTNPAAGRRMQPAKPQPWFGAAAAEVSPPVVGLFNRPNFANIQRGYQQAVGLGADPVIGHGYVNPFHWQAGGGFYHQQPQQPAPFIGRNFPVPHTSGKKLTELTVGDIVDLLTHLDNIDRNQMPKYRDTVIANNINGRVLMNCDVGELKQALQMTFGDWELFRIAILTLRQQEVEGHQLQSAEAPTTRTIRLPSFSGLPRVPTKPNLDPSTSQPPEPVVVEAASGGDTKPSSREHNLSGGSSRSTSDRQFLGLSYESDKSGSVKSQEVARSSSGKRFAHQNTLEKQVTMEDQMICGVLQTLNEEAQEDTMAIIDSAGISTTPRPSIPRPTSSTTLSPILSDPEESGGPAELYAAAMDRPSELHIPSRDTDVIYLVTPPISPSNRGGRVVREATEGASRDASTPKVKWEIGGSSPPMSPVSRQKRNSVSSIASSIVSNASCRDYGDDNDGNALIASGRYPVIVQTDNKRGRSASGKSDGMTSSSSFDKLSRLKNRIVGTFTGGDKQPSAGQSGSVSSLASGPMSRKSSLKKSIERKDLQQLSVQTMMESAPLVGASAGSPSRKSVDFHDDLTPTAAAVELSLTQSSGSEANSPESVGSRTRVTVISEEQRRRDLGYPLQAVTSEPFVVAPVQKYDSAGSLPTTGKKELSPEGRKRSSSETVV